MTTALARFEETELAADAVDALRGELPTYTDEYDGWEWEQLADEARLLNTGMLALRIKRTLIVMEVVRNAGELVTDRRVALQEFATEINTSTQVLMNDLRVLRYLTPQEVLEDFGLLKPTHLQDAARLTSRAGESPDDPARRERVRAALEEAVDGRENTRQLRARLEAERDAADEVIYRQTDGSEVLPPAPERPEPGSREEQRQRADHEDRLRRLEALLQPERLARDLTRDLRANEVELGNWSLVEGYLSGWFGQRLGGVA